MRRTVLSEEPLAPPRVRALSAPVVQQPERQERLESAPPRRRKQAPRTRGERWNRSEKLLLTLGLAAPGAAMALGGWLLWASSLPPVPPAHEEPGNVTYHLLTQAGRQVIEPPRARKTPLSPADRARFVAANAGPLEVARQVQGQTFGPHLIPSYSAAFPEYSTYRALARTFALEAQVRAERGDLAGATDSYIDAIALGQQVGQRGLLMGRFVGIACEATGQSGLWKLADRLDAGSARRAALRLDGLARTRTPFLEVARSEALWSQRALHDALSRTSTAALAAQLSGGDSDRLQQLALGSLFPKRTILETHQRLTRQFLARIQQPWLSPARQTEVVEPLDPINALLYPDPTGAEMADRRAIAANALTATRLAIRAYSLEHGAYPVSLQTLVDAGYLKTLPLDPFTDGAPLRLKGAVVYSVGPDGRDDGGRGTQGIKGGDPADASGDYLGPVERQVT